jgi:hypothetical protein
MAESVSRRSCPGGALTNFNRATINTDAGALFAIFASSLLTTEMPLSAIFGRSASDSGEGGPRMFQPERSRQPQISAANKDASGAAGSYSTSAEAIGLPFSASTHLSESNFLGSAIRINCSFKNAIRDCWALLIPSSKTNKKSYRLPQPPPRPLPTKTRLDGRLPNI